MVKIVGLAPKPSPHVVGRPQPLREVPTFRVYYISPGLSKFPRNLRNSREDQLKVARFSSEKSETVYFEALYAMVVLVCR